MKAFLFVFLGSGIGGVLRYAISLVFAPAAIRGRFGMQFQIP